MFTPIVLLHNYINAFQAGSRMYAHTHTVQIQLIDLSTTSELP